jgi:hypothetical protein
LVNVRLSLDLLLRILTKVMVFGRVLTGRSLLVGSAVVSSSISLLMDVSLLFFLDVDMGINGDLVHIRVMVLI